MSSGSRVYLDDANALSPRAGELGIGVPDMEIRMHAITANVRFLRAWPLVAFALVSVFQASPLSADLVFDRPLPTQNQNVGSEPDRINVTVDPSGPEEFAGEDFVLPATGAAWRIDTLRTWVVPHGDEFPADNDADFDDETAKLGDHFTDVTLFLGLADGGISAVQSGNFLAGSDATDNPDIVIQRVQYPGPGPERDYQSGQSWGGIYRAIYQIDFTNLDLVYPPGTQLQFGAYGGGRRWFAHAMDPNGSGVPPLPEDDDFYRHFSASGPSFLGTWNLDRNGTPGTHAPGRGGWHRSVNVNVQVFASPLSVLEIPTLSTAGFALLGLMLLAAGFWVLRRPARLYP